MKLIVPYVNLNEAVKIALEMENITVQYIKTPYKNDYFDLFSRLWENGNSFIILEQDILPWPGALQILWNCEKFWCVYTYKIKGHYDWALGCTKFSHQLMEKYPELMKEVETGNIWSNYSSKHWSELDVRINQTLLRLYGLDPHVHQPPVVHLNIQHRLEDVVNPDFVEKVSGSQI